jgi:hypothetical protein
MKVRVQCYSGYKAGPGDAWYKVLADDGNLYILRRKTSVPDGGWELVSFRKQAG